VVVDRAEQVEGLGSGGHGDVDLVGLAGRDGVERGDRRVGPRARIGCSVVGGGDREPVRGRAVVFEPELDGVGGGHAVPRLVVVVETRSGPAGTGGRVLVDLDVDGGNLVGPGGRGREAGGEHDDEQPGGGPEHPVERVRSLHGETWRPGSG